jgi:hypothetical protein
MKIKVGYLPEAIREKYLNLAQETFTKIPGLIKDPKLSAVIKNIISSKNFCLKKYKDLGASQGEWTGSQIIINIEVFEDKPWTPALVIVHEFLHSKFNDHIDNEISKEYKLLHSLLDSPLAQNEEWLKCFYSNNYFLQLSHYQIKQWFTPILGKMSSEEHYALTHKHEFYPQLLTLGCLDLLENTTFKNWYKQAIGVII